MTRAAFALWVMASMSTPRNIRAVQRVSLGMQYDRSHDREINRPMTGSDASENSGEFSRDVWP